MTEHKKMSPSIGTNVAPLDHSHTVEEHQRDGKTVKEHQALYPAPPPLKEKPPIPLVINEDGQVFVVTGTPKREITIDGKTYLVYDLEALDRHENFSEFLGI